MQKIIRPEPSQLQLICAVAAILTILSGCTSTLKTQSENFNSRVSIVVIHHTTSNFEDSYRVLTRPSSNPVSSHYLIPEPDDETYSRSRVQTYELVPESHRAWHAGKSYWSGKTGLNDQSIGIELVNRTWCHASAEANAYTDKVDRLCFYPDFADSQLALLVELLEDILERYPEIKPTNIIGHSDIAPDRKIDPGPRFPWQRLARLGYGAWFDDETVVRYWERFREEPLPLLNIQKALGTYGYKIEPSGENDEQTRNVLRAFQLHFRPMEVTSETTPDSTAVLFALIDKYYPDQLDELLQVEEEPVPPAADEDAALAGT